MYNNMPCVMIIVIFLCDAPSSSKWYPSVFICQLYDITFKLSDHRVQNPDRPDRHKVPQGPERDHSRESPPINSTGFTSRQQIVWCLRLGPQIMFGFKLFALPKYCGLLHTTFSSLRKLSLILMSVLLITCLVQQINFFLLTIMKNKLSIILSWHGQLMVGMANLDGQLMVRLRHPHVLAGGTQAENGWVALPYMGPFHRTAFFLFIVSLMAGK